MLTPPNGQPLGLLTDMYELTMALGYWRLGLHQRRTSFYLSFRHLPFRGGYALTAGMADFLEYLQRLRFSPSDLQFLEKLPGNDGKPIFGDDFLRFLGDYQFAADVDAMPEGTVAFPHQPLVRITGPVLDCQIVESALLHLVGFQTLVATKAARICAAARGMPVIEFGLRRAQGSDGGIAASRAAYIGGCAATSNLLAAKQLGIPCSGTLGHSWIMLFDSELEAFQAYARALPNNSIFLVDTYDTLTGIRNAIQAGIWLRQNGHRLGGIRLDSGDLAYLSSMARQLLDQAGFEDAVIVASNDLDETVIDSLVQQRAAINVWGVGTRLTTSYDHPALGAVYKISAIQDADGRWHPRIKISEQAIKVSTPGMLQVQRYVGPDGAVADMIFDELAPPPAAATMVDPLDPTRRRRMDERHRRETLLQPVIRGGTPVDKSRSLAEIREYAQSQLNMFHPALKRLMNPHSYPVGLEEGLYEAKTRLVMDVRGFDIQSERRPEVEGEGDD